MAKLMIWKIELLDKLPKDNVCNDKNHETTEETEKRWGRVLWHPTYQGVMEHIVEIST